MKRRNCDWCGESYEPKRKPALIDGKLLGFCCKPHGHLHWRMRRMRRIAEKLTVDDVMKKRVAEVLSEELGWPLEPPGRRPK